MNSQRPFVPNNETGALSEESTKAYFSRLGWSIFVLGIASSIASIGLSALSSLILPQSLLNNSTLITLLGYIISVISIYGVATPLLCKVLAPLPKVTPLKRKLSFGNVLGGFCVAFLLMTVGSYISSFVLGLIQTLLNTSTQNPIEDMISPNDPVIVLITAVFVGVILPIFEEILFRKILCNKLLALGEAYAIIVSATIFGLIHGNFYQFAYAFLLGALFALIYVKTGKIIYSTIYHIAINLLGAVVTPWLIAQIDMEGFSANLEKLFGLLESGSTEAYMNLYLSMLPQMFLLTLYEALSLVPAIFGIVLLSKALRNKTIKLDGGILTPSKKNALANIFCTVGVAAAITYFTFTFLLSIIPEGKLESLFETLLK